MNIFNNSLHICEGYAERGKYDRAYRGNRDENVQKNALLRRKVQRGQRKSDPKRAAHNGSYQKLFMIEKILCEAR